MRLSTQVKPISYVNANAAQITDELNGGGRTDRDHAEGQGHPPG